MSSTTHISWKTLEKNRAEQARSLREETKDKKPLQAFVRKAGDGGDHLEQERKHFDNDDVPDPSVDDTSQASDTDSLRSVAEVLNSSKDIRGFSSDIKPPINVALEMVDGFSDIVLPSDSAVEVELSKVVKSQYNLVIAVDVVAWSISVDTILYSIPNIIK